MGYWLPVVDLPGGRLNALLQGFSEWGLRITSVGLVQELVTMQTTRPCPGARQAILSPSVLSRL